MDPVAVRLLGRYPLPTSSGIANNYRRVADETVDQDQFSVRVDHRLPSNRDQIFGRLTRFRENVIPVTPLPEGSGVTTGTLGPRDPTSWAFASSYQRTVSTNIVNVIRVGDTRRYVDRQAADLGGTPADVLGLPGIPATAQFPTTVPTFLIGGYQQLGSPTNTASRFRHERDGDCRYAHVAERPTHAEAGRRSPMGADGYRRPHVAIGDTGRDRANDEQQCVRGIRHTAAEPGRRSGAAFESAIRRPLVQHGCVSDGGAVHH